MGKKPISGSWEKDVGRRQILHVVVVVQLIGIVKVKKKLWTYTIAFFAARPSAPGRSIYCPA